MKIATKLTRNRLSVWAVGLSVLFTIFVSVVPMPLLIDTLNGVFLGIVAAVIVAYFPLVWYTIGSTSFDRAGQLSLGILMIWLSIAMSRAWSSFYRYLGSPPELLNHWMIALSVFIAVIGGTLFVTAPGYYPPQPIPFGGRNRRLLVVFALIGGALAIYSHFR